MNDIKLSVIIPVYNGAKTIEALVENLENELASKFNLELVLVNDGSPSDNSATVCETLTHNKEWIKFIDLSGNFGEHNAVMAGLNYCTGDMAVIIDDDFQNPPSEIIKLVEELNQGYDVVYSYYQKKQHSFLRNLGSKFNDLIANTLIQKPKKLYLSSFKAINRFVINEIIKYKGPYPYIDGLILRFTRNYSTVLVKHNAREEGKSGYTIHKLISLWLNMFTNFSILPLRIATILGFVVAILGLLAAIVFILQKLQNPALPAGWTSIIVTLLMISGVQLFTIGMLGEYLGRLFLKDNGNPQFVVRRIITNKGIQKC
ncbi:glycosyltransferase family 2 protein [Lutibacter sp.]